jgi:hypothetical protein
MADLFWLARLQSGGPTGPVMIDKTHRTARSTAAMTDILWLADPIDMACRLEPRISRVHGSFTPFNDPSFVAKILEADALPWFCEILITKSNET